MGALTGLPVPVRDDSFGIHDDDGVQGRIDNRAGLLLNSAEGLFGAFLFAQIEREGDTVVSTLFEQRRTDQHRHATAVFAEIFLLVRLHGPGRLEVRHRQFVAGPPFLGCQIRPTHTGRTDVFAAPLHHLEKCFIGPDNPALKIPGEDPHEICVDQAPDPGFEPRGPFPQLCFRLLARGDLDLEVVDRCHSSIRHGSELPQ
jgi:hypothetical protein